MNGPGDLRSRVSEALSRKRSLQRGSLRSFEGLKRGAFLVDVVVVRLGVRDASLLSADALPIQPNTPQLSERSIVEDHPFSDDIRCGPILQMIPWLETCLKDHSTLIDEKDSIVHSFLTQLFGRE